MIFNGVQTPELLIFAHYYCLMSSKLLFQWGLNTGTANSSHSYGLMISKFRPPQPTGMVFQCGQNTGIANSEHFYGLMISKFQPS